MRLERPYVLLMFQAVLMQASYFGIRPMVTYRALDVGATPTELGVIAAAFGLFSLLMAVPVGRGVDWMGPGRMTILGIGTEVVGVVAAAYSESARMLFWAGGIIGIGHVMAMAGHQTLAARTWPAHERERVYNGYATFVSVGQAMGPPLGMLIASRIFVGDSLIGGIDPISGLTAAAVIALISLPAALIMRERTAPMRLPRAKKAKTKEPGAMRQQWPVMLTSATVVAALDVLATFIPLWGETNGISPTIVGWLLASRAIFTLLIRTVATRLVRWGGRIRVMSISIFGACIGFVILPFVDETGAFFAMALLGFGLGLAAPMTLVMLMDQVSEERQGSAVGWRLASNRAGQMLLPLAMGGVVALGGVSLVWWATSVVLASSVVLMLFRLSATRGSNPGAL